MDTIFCRKKVQNKKNQLQNFKLFDPEEKKFLGIKLSFV